MTHPGQPRDIDLKEWADGVGFHPANTPLKQAGHEAARNLVMLLATHLHQLLPPGRDKSIVFTGLEEVLMRANRALALGGGPRAGVELEPSPGHDGLSALLSDTKEILAQLNADVPEDPRIADYKADQLASQRLPFPEQAADPAPEQPFTQLHYSTGEEPNLVRSIDVLYDEGPQEVRIEVREHHESENVLRFAAMPIDDPEILEEIASGLLSGANRLRREFA